MFCFTRIFQIKQLNILHVLSNICLDVRNRKRRAKRLVATFRLRNTFMKRKRAFFVVVVVITSIV